MQKDLIAQAATQAGVTLTEFVTAAAEARAQHPARPRITPAIINQSPGATPLTA